MTTRRRMKREKARQLKQLESKNKPLKTLVAAVA